MPVDNTPAPAQNMVTLPIETVRQYQEQRAQYESMAAQRSNQTSSNRQ